ncbi:Poly(ADP-ribose) glycohydrolase [Holothuria leucospilota]|uniref:poly(ADP-ribose) glycohydrolase n=1 Tax=Holothuria leucospilota TaxID=206669 RepID=A0A9Q0YHZ7_HOLLE|nr:Poly(ADP-ribose) glycohydrolase [Holothuria leucospilota]
MSGTKCDKRGVRKRFIQTTLDFGSNKKIRKDDKVDETSAAKMGSSKEFEQDSMREILASAAEKRMEESVSSQSQQKDSDPCVLDLEHNSDQLAEKYSSVNSLKDGNNTREPEETLANLREDSMLPGTSSYLPKCSEHINVKDSEEKQSHLDERTKINDVRRVSSEGSNEDSPTLEYNNSQPLFSESDSQDETSTVTVTSSVSTSGVSLGIELSKLQRVSNFPPPVTALKTEKGMTVLFEPNFQKGEAPKPSPLLYQDKWDANHVRMPCSHENLYPVVSKEGKKEVKSRWELVQNSLLNDISSSVDLEESILLYNSRYNKRWNFEAMHHFFTEVVDRSETSNFFKSTLPQIVQLALKLPKICTHPIPLLKKNTNHTIVLTQYQIASLLANAFFCTFPRRNAQQKKSEYSSFPDINFNRLFEGRSSRKQEKLKCIINYFRRVTSETPCGTVSFERRSIMLASNFPQWKESQCQLGNLHVSSKGTIEDDGKGMLQIDFANKFVGGGVLGHGCVQEEIRFLICPELIVSRLFTEVLGKNECLVVKGAEQYSRYSGYANSFKWTGNYRDTTPRDTWGRRETEIVAIDALHFYKSDNQYQPDQLKRELNKAFCGFYHKDVPDTQVPAVATGNWGCGAFGGDPRLKALLQLMAAAETNRDVAYFTFSDGDLCRDIHNMHQFLQSQAVSVGELWSVLCKYNVHIQGRKKQYHPKLYPFIFDVFTSYDSDTDSMGGTTKKQDCEDGEGRFSSPDYRESTP